MEKIKFLKDLSPKLVESIYPKMRIFFDQVTFENYNEYLMAYEYGPHIIYESFEFVPSYYGTNDHINEFESRKLFLFLNGVYLYKIHTADSIELVCDAYDIKYKVNGRQPMEDKNE